MDMWGEMEMVGADVEMTCCETLNLLVPANAEMVIEGRVNLKDTKVGDVTSPSMNNLPHFENVPSCK